MSWGAVGAIGAALSGVTSLANLGSQIANLSYQKKLQNTIFQREDTAIQRRVADLKAAGLSPVLAAGSAAGSGGTVSTAAPQLTDVSDKLGMALNLISMRKNIDKTDVDIEKSKEEVNYLKAQQLRALAEIKGINVNTAAKYLDYKIQKETGTTSNKGGVSGMFKDAYGIVEQISRNQKGKAIDNEVSPYFKSTLNDVKQKYDSDPNYKNKVDKATRAYRRKK